MSARHLNRNLITVTLAIVAVLLVEARVARAQSAPPPAPAETRAEEQRRAREEKAQSVEAYEPNPIERAMDLVEGRFMPLLARDGIHWKLGSLTTGSGLAYGGGFRNRRLFDRQGTFNIWAAASLKRFWALEARFQLPQMADGRAFLEVYARRQQYPQVDFFGIGPGAQRTDHTSFSSGDAFTGFWVGIRPMRATKWAGGLEYTRPRIDIGQNSLVPTVSDIFTDEQAPGLAFQRNYLRSSTFFEVDTREPRNARKGGFYRVDVSHFEDQTGIDSFNRVDLDLRQYASELAERRVLALRLFAATTEATEGGRVPFFLMPALGGHDSLRGFRDYRFRAPHALLTQVEYRWEIWSGFDAALFYDAGKVALARKNLTFSSLERAYGFGFRFNTDDGVIMRVDVGLGSRDGKHLYIVFGDVF